MRSFFIKTVLLVMALLCAVLYGMETAKDGLLKMEGKADQNTTSEWFNFQIPGLAAGDRSNPNKAEAVGFENPDLKSSAVKENADPPMDIEKKLAKLDDLHGFNPYSAMGDKLSNSVSSVFEKGIEAFSSLMSHLLK